MAEPHPFGHEPSSIADTRILKLGGIALLVVVVAVTALYFILQDGVMPFHALNAARQGRIPPSPRLQAHPDPDLAALRAQKMAKLSGYLWLDDTHAFARIPIREAMALYARQHQAGSGEPAPAASSAEGLQP